MTVSSRNLAYCALLHENYRGGAVKVDRKVLVVIKNDSLRETIISLLLTYIKRKNIYVCIDDENLLYIAAKYKPDSVILVYSAETDCIISSLHMVLEKFNGILLFNVESDIYEELILSKVENCDVYEKIYPVRMDRINIFIPMILLS